MYGTGRDIGPREDRDLNTDRRPRRALGVYLPPLMLIAGVVEVLTAINPTALPRCSRDGVVPLSLGEAGPV